jgi:hypothetical protein
LVPTRRPDPSPAKGDPGKLPVGPVSWLPVTNLLSAPSRRISPVALVRISSPVTVAGQRWTFTIFPIPVSGARREILFATNDLGGILSRRFAVVKQADRSTGGIAKTLPAPVTETIGTI